jgi:hypothetical protein
MKNDRMKNDRIKSDRLKNDRIKSDRIKTDRIKSITDPRGVTYICEFLCEFTTICKNDLTCLSVTKVGLIDEKTDGRKSCETVPLETGCSIDAHNLAC